MPSNPNNPFNNVLIQLNGATFPSASVLNIQGDAQLAGDQLEVDGPGTGPQTNAGTITITDYSYTPGNYQGNGYGYQPPHFGIITFSGIPGQAFFISGFTDHGILLAPNHYTSQLGYLYTGHGYILRIDGFSPENFEFPVIFSYDASVYQDVVCFAEGARIQTETGFRAVEALAVGDQVITASGETRPIKWIGQMLARPGRHPRPWEVNPVRVKANAFGAGLPQDDLRLSPGHAVYVDGVLVPVGHLVNSATIVQENVDQVRYFHVELDSHDVLLAEGLPCESYLDDGNRKSFHNAGESVELFGRLDPKSWADACAPMVAAGPQLTVIQQRLHAHAAELGWIKSEAADLRIEADGVAIPPLHRVGNRYWFSVPAAAQLTLRSNSGVLRQVMPGLNDGRELGVAISALRLDGEAIALDGDAIGTGFYGLEQHEPHSWRWTNGEATLALALTAPAMLEVELVMVAPSWTRSAPRLRVVA